LMQTLFPTAKSGNSFLGCVPYGFFLLSGNPGRCDYVSPLRDGYPPEDLISLLHSHPNLTPSSYGHPPRIITSLEISLPPLRFFFMKHARSLLWTFARSAPWEGRFFVPTKNPSIMPLSYCASFFSASFFSPCVLVNQIWVSFLVVFSPPTPNAHPWRERPSPSDPATSLQRAAVIPSPPLRCLLGVFGSG